jgi:hypothetical protein
MSGRPSHLNRSNQIVGVLSRPRRPLRPAANGRIMRTIQRLADAGPDLVLDRNVPICELEGTLSRLCLTGRYALSPV